MDTSMENIAYKSLYMQLKTEYKRILDSMPEIEDEKYKAINKQRLLQTQNENLTIKLKQMEITLNDLRNQIKDLKGELDATKRNNNRKTKYSEQDAKKIHDALKKYGGTLSFRQAAYCFNISTSTLQLLMKKFY